MGKNKTKPRGRRSGIGKGPKGNGIIRIVASIFLVLPLLIYVGSLFLPNNRSTDTITDADNALQKEKKEATTDPLLEKEKSNISANEQEKTKHKDFPDYKVEKNAQLPKQKNRELADSGKKKNTVVRKKKEGQPKELNCAEVRQYKSLSEALEQYSILQKELSTAESNHLMACLSEHIINLGGNLYKQPYNKYRLKRLEKIRKLLQQVNSNELNVLRQKVINYEQHAMFYQNTVAEIKNKPCTDQRWNILTHSIADDMINKGIYNTNEQYNQLRDLNRSLMLWVSDRGKYERACKSPSKAQIYMNQLQVSDYYRKKLNTLISKK